MITARFFLALLLLAAPLGAEAQQTGKVYRVGFLWDRPAVWPHALEGFRQGLRDLGWVEGKNIVVEYRWAEGHYDRLASLAEELVRLYSARDPAARLAPAEPVIAAPHRIGAGG